MGFFLKKHRHYIKNDASKSVQNLFFPNISTLERPQLIKDKTESNDSRDGHLVFAVYVKRLLPGQNNYFKNYTSKIL